MDYNHITSFLDKFKKILFQKEEIKNIVIKTISEEVSCKINDDSVKIKNGFIFTDNSPIIRSEIMVHKKQILEKLKTLLPNHKFLDIK